jgi:acyl-CoA synthetase (AMP-forming)/AMP-acid ligase II
MNIVDQILFQCKLNPFALAICVPGSYYHQVTYDMLERFIHSAAHMALKSGLTSGNLAAVFTGDTVLHLALTLGLMRVGVTTLSLRAPKLVPGIQPDVVLTDVPGQISDEATVLGIDRSWLENVEADAPHTSSHGADDIYRIILTSGSTGVSKGVALSHRTMAERTACFQCEVRIVQVVEDSALDSAKQFLKKGQQFSIHRGTGIVTGAAGAFDSSTWKPQLNPSGPNVFSTHGFANTGQREWSLYVLRMPVALDDGKDFDKMFVAVAHPEIAFLSGICK